VNNLPHSRAALVLAVTGAVVSGALVAAQSRINGELSVALSDGYLAAFISFGFGCVIIAVIVAALPVPRRGVAVILGSIRAGSTPWWFASGGGAGALFVLSQGLTGAILGVALFTVATVTGQTLSAMIVDRRGMGTMHPKPITRYRLTGALLAVVAVVFSVAPQVQFGTAPWALILPVLAGFGLAWQQAFNGQLRVISGSALTATFFNFVVGASVLGIVLLVHAAFVGLPMQLAANPWLYLGGPIGVVFILGYTIVVRYTGVLVLGLSAIAGQLAASVVFDLLLPVAGRAVAWTTVAGTALTLVAIGITAIRPRRGDTPAAAPAPAAATAKATA
jgi:transporter family-2 protein